MARRFLEPDQGGGGSVGSAYPGEAFADELGRHVTFFDEDVRNDPPIGIAAYELETHLPSSDEIIERLFRRFAVRLIDLGGINVGNADLDLIIRRFDDDTVSVRNS